MSTPSGKPFDPFDLSPYAPKRARERSILERPPSASESPLHHPDPRGSGDEEAMTDAAAALRCPGAPLAEESRQYALDLDDGNPARAHASAQPIDPAPADDRDDGDLARLQSSVHYLRREAGLDLEKRGQGIDGRERLPRASQLNPVPGLGPLDLDGLRPRSDQYINGVRVPPSLAPKRLRRPRPMGARRDHLRGPLRVLLASVIAAPIAYYFSATRPALQADPASHFSLASFAARLVASAEFPSPKDKLQPREAEAYDTIVASRNKLLAEPESAPETSPGPAAPVAVAVALPATAPVSEPPAPAVRSLDPDTVKLLLQQGQQLVAAGDLISARQVYQRAAEAGNAAAALALGATFDPVVLAKIGMPGVGADVEKARSWYEKAREFGSADAPQRLATLANR
ncbi:MAG TPA: hypothetical protein VKW08_23665 [Xanthobacteraceae bacterium]|jgi:hypothetical protein|nr:hypothetical protein [Xanthobacteraceae bacterium]